MDDDRWKLGFLSSAYHPRPLYVQLLIRDLLLISLFLSNTLEMSWLVDSFPLVLIDIYTDSMTQDTCTKFIAIRDTTRQETKPGMLPVKFSYI